MHSNSSENQRFGVWNIGNFWHCPLGTRFNDHCDIMYDIFLNDTGKTKIIVFIHFTNLENYFLYRSTGWKCFRLFKIFKLHGPNNSSNIFAVLLWEWNYWSFEKTSVEFDTLELVWEMSKIQNSDDDFHGKCERANSSNCVDNLRIKFAEFSKNSQLSLFAVCCCKKHG